MIKRLIPFFFIFCLAHISTNGQKSEPSPTTGTGIRILKVPSIKDELSEAEIEPQMKQFRLNLRFTRAKYHYHDGPIPWHEYSWDYFPEVTVILQFYKYPAGYFSSHSTEQSQALLSKLMRADIDRGDGREMDENDIKIDTVFGKEVTVLVQGHIVNVRTFADRDIRYVLMARPKTPGVQPLIQKMFESFEFINGGGTPASSASIPSPSIVSTVASSPGVGVENGLFISKEGAFSIALSELPQRTIDKGTAQAKAKNIDAGKQYVWIFERTFYTVYYDPPVDSDGNAYPQIFADMESGTRKGIYNGGATLLSEKPIMLGKNRGTEFRSSSSNGVHYITRIYLIGDMGYQIMGGYADEHQEKEVLDILNSFRPLSDK